MRDCPEVFPLEMDPAAFAAWLAADIDDEDALPCRNPQAFGVICDDQVGA